MQTEIPATQAAAGKERIEHFISQEKTKATDNRAGRQVVAQMDFGQFAQHKSRLLLGLLDPRPDDGLLLSFAKLVASPFRMYHALFTAPLVMHTKRPAACLLRWLCPTSWPEAHPDSHYRLAVDLYVLMYFVVVACSYVGAYWIATAHVSGWLASAVMAILVIPAFFRMYEILCYLTLILGHPTYQPDRLMRSLFNIFGHFVETALAFAVFDLGCAWWCGDTFSSEATKSITDSLVTPLYFSFVTVATVGYGDYAADDVAGKMFGARRNHDRNFPDYDCDSTAPSRAPAGRVIRRMKLRRSSSETPHGRLCSVRRHECDSDSI